MGKIKGIWNYFRRLELMESISRENMKSAFYNLSGEDENDARMVELFDIWTVPEKILEFYKNIKKY
ncbi:MAG: hypothetical protein QW286_01430 [Candidatus Aenigmatarchaeota archaeon]